MDHPPPPWELKIEGVMLQTLHLLDPEQVRPFIRPEFELVAYGRKVVGGLYYAHYGPGSTVEYHELGVFLSFVRFAGKTGIWVSNMYVDDERSLALGTQALGLPKEMAQFRVEQGRESRVIAHQGGRVICVLAYGRQYYAWKQRVGGHAFGILDGDVMRFRNDWRVRGGVARAGIVIPPESPLAAYGLDRPLVTLCAKDGSASLAKDLERLGRLHPSEPA